MRSETSASADGVAQVQPVRAQAPGSHVQACGPEPPDPSSLEHFLVPLRSLLDDPDVTEICINQPGHAHVERDSGWRIEVLAFASYDWCMALARLVANYTRQRISPSEPLLSATLPGGERVQFVLPPATERGTVSITVRRPASALWTLEQLQDRRVFDAVRVLGTSEPGDEMAKLLSARDIVGFLRQAVQQRKNILLSGATGSGKTTLAKALILEVPPEDRLITIEDVRELVLAHQPNHVRLFYSQGGQGQAAVSAGELLACAKRQRPDRVFVSELRTGEEVYDYLVSVNTGHPGSITSVHADSAELAFVALAQLMKRSEAGRGMNTREGVELAQLSVDVVLQCCRHGAGGCRQVSEIWYDPSAKRRGLA
jgi:type IV secretion system protein VirB11